MEIKILTYTETSWAVWQKFPFPSTQEAEAEEGKPRNPVHPAQQKENPGQQKEGK